LRRELAVANIRITELRHQSLFRAEIQSLRSTAAALEVTMTRIMGT
jgi:hypothetical protein